jgi:hypothetical protein
MKRKSLKGVRASLIYGGQAGGTNDLPDSTTSHSDLPSWKELPKDDKKDKKEDKKKGDDKKKKDKDKKKDDKKKKEEPKKKDKYCLTQTTNEVSAPVPVVVISN